MLARMAERVSYIPAHMVFDRSLSPTARHVYHHLDLQIGEGQEPPAGDPWESNYAQIARELSVSERTVMRSVGELREAGYITTARTPAGTVFYLTCRDQTAPTEPKDPLRILRDEARSRRWDVWARDDFRCRTCGSRRDLTVDHIRPLSVGGESSIENLQTLCATCNSGKGAAVGKRLPPR
jgi:DNA-binding transcriptional ArsR family regulator